MSRIRVGSVAPVGGGHDKGSELGMGVERGPWEETVSGAWEMPVGRRSTLWFRGVAANAWLE